MTDDMLMWSRSGTATRGNRIVIISYTCGIATKIRRITAGFIYDLRTALTFFIFTVSELSKDFALLVI